MIAYAGYQMQNDVLEAYGTGGPEAGERAVHANVGKMIGMVSGALSGAAVGSLIPIPIIGTGVGMLVGAFFGGLFGMEDKTTADNLHSAGQAAIRFAGYARK